MSSEETSQLAKTAELAQFAPRPPPEPKKFQTSKKVSRKRASNRCQEETSYLTGSDTPDRKTKLHTIIQGYAFQNNHIRSDVSVGEIDHKLQLFVEIKTNK